MHLRLSNADTLLGGPTFSGDGTIVLAVLVATLGREREISCKSVTWSAVPYAPFSVS